MTAVFAEETGAVLQVPRDALDHVWGLFERVGLRQWVRIIGRPGGTPDTVRIRAGKEVVLKARRSDLHCAWSELSSRMQGLRDNPQCALEEYARLRDLSDPA